MRIILLYATTIGLIVNLQSCNFLKDCDKHIPDPILLPLEVLNRNDTITLADSIVFYTKFYTNGTDLKSGNAILCKGRVSKSYKYA